MAPKGRKVFIEDGLGLVEGPGRSDGGVEGGLSCVVELVGDEVLELEDRGGAKAVALGKLATHDVLKMTHLTKTAPIFTFFYRATVFCLTAPIFPSFYRT